MEGNNQQAWQRRSFWTLIALLAVSMTGTGVSIAFMIDNNRHRSKMEDRLSAMESDMKRVVAESHLQTPYVLSERVKALEFGRKQQQLRNKAQDLFNLETVKFIQRVYEKMDIDK